MILMNVIISFIFQRCCLCAEVIHTYGYLFQGEVEKSKNTLNKVYGYIERKGDLHFNFFASLQYQYSCIMNSLGNSNLVPYKLILLDNERRYWNSNIDNWRIYNTFEEIGKEIEREVGKKVEKEKCIKIAGIHKGDKKNLENSVNNEPLKIFLDASKKLSMIFKNFVTDCCINENAFIGSFNVYNNSKRNSALIVNCIRKTFDSRSKFIEQLKYITNSINSIKTTPNSNIYQSKIKTLRKEYNHDKNLSIIGKRDKFNDQSESECKQYTERIYALMNEASAFLNNKRCSDYVFRIKHIKYTIQERKKVLIFYVNFEGKSNFVNIAKEGDFSFIDANTDKWVLVDQQNSSQKTTVNNSNEVRNDDKCITHSDFEFSNEENNEITVPKENITILKDSKNAIFLIMIESNILKENKVKKVNFKKVGRSFEINVDKSTKK